MANQDSVRNELIRLARQPKVTSEKGIIRSPNDSVRGYVSDLVNAEVINGCAERRAGSKTLDNPTSSRRWQLQFEENISGASIFFCVSHNGIIMAFCDEFPEVAFIVNKTGFTKFIYNNSTTNAEVQSYEAVFERGTKFWYIKGDDDFVVVNDYGDYFTFNKKGCVQFLKTSNQNHTYNTVSRLRELRYGLNETAGLYVDVVYSKSLHSKKFYTAPASDSKYVSIKGNISTIPVYDNGKLGASSNTTFFDKYRPVYVSMIPVWSVYDSGLYKVRQHTVNTTDLTDVKYGTLSGTLSATNTELNGISSREYSMGDSFSPEGSYAIESRPCMFFTKGSAISGSKPKLFMYMDYRFYIEIAGRLASTDTLTTMPFLSLKFIKVDNLAYPKGSLGFEADGTVSTGTFGVADSAEGFVTFIKAVEYSTEIPFRYMPMATGADLDYIANGENIIRYNLSTGGADIDQKYTGYIYEVECPEEIVPFLAQAEMFGGTTTGWMFGTDWDIGTVLTEPTAPEPLFSDKVNYFEYHEDSLGNLVPAQTEGFLSTARILFTGNVYIKKDTSTGKAVEFADTAWVYGINNTLDSDTSYVIMKNLGYDNWIVSYNFSKYTDLSVSNIKANTGEYTISTGRGYIASGWDVICRYDDYVNWMKFGNRFAVWNDGKIIGISQKVFMDSEYKPIYSITDKRETKTYDDSISDGLVPCQTTASILIGYMPVMALDYMSLRSFGYVKEFISEGMNNPIDVAENLGIIYKADGGTLSVGSFINSFVFTNQYNFGQEIVAIKPILSGVVVFTKSDMFYVSNQGNREEVSGKLSLRSSRIVRAKNYDNIIFGLTDGNDIFALTVAFADNGNPYVKCENLSGAIPCMQWDSNVDFAYSNGTIWVATGSDIWGFFNGGWTKKFEFSGKTIHSISSFRDRLAVSFDDDIIIRCVSIDLADFSIPFIS